MRCVMMLLAVLLSAACGARQANEGGDDPLASNPEWSPCVGEGEFETCAQVCDAEGMRCVAAGCPAEPMYCKPDSCNMATSALGLEAICSDPTMGTFVAAGCEDPIEFIFTDTARCCCEG
jgi:hypothetical protein